ncbi:MAG: Rne/Rng family ribonuclease, partial [Deltaproteobacteria bacterium]|nr:Rne/Rng family ribonuclease [Deltaproteobacteria bacterium]
KRTTDTITRLITEPCPYCEGRGFIKSRMTVTYEILRDIEKKAASSESDVIKIRVHPQVADILYQENKGFVEDIEKKYKKGIVIEPSVDYLTDQYEVED